MPIYPKQQPPYYTPSENTPNVPITQLHTILTSEESDTTNMTTVGNYVIPTNTLTENGNVIELTYWGNSYNNPTTATIMPKIFGTALTTYDWVGNVEWTAKLNIIRTTSNTVAYMLIICTDTYTVPQQGTIGSIDFTTTNNLHFEIQAPTDGNIRLSSGYINLIK